MTEDKGAKTKKVTGTKKPVGIKILGVFALAMINVAAVLSIRNFPSMAEFGWSSIGWYIIGTILFLIPISLAGAELATGWPEGGGVYALSLIHISEPTRRTPISYAVFCLKK